MHGWFTVCAVTDPELPEFPEAPEPPEVAVPVAVAAPVFPELALPEVAVVALPDEEPALPLVPPRVEPLAFEAPEEPDDGAVVEPSVAVPEPPEFAVPVAEPPDPEPVEALSGLAVAEPVVPEELVDPEVPVAPPVVPVELEVVCPAVLALPLAALEVEVEFVLTAPEAPPAPELPEVAVGLAVAFPVLVDPVEPVLPVSTTMLTVHVPE